MSRENLPQLPGPGEPADREPPAGRRAPPAGRWAPLAVAFDGLAAIRADPVMRGHARRLAGDLAEDLLQHTWYTVAQAVVRGADIRDLRAYWYRVMVNNASRMREDISRHGVPAEDPVAAAGPRASRELAVASAEDEALRRLLSSGRLALLRRGRARLWTAIPATSPDPGRYREAIWALAERIVAGQGPETRVELNDALVCAYPAWFAAPGVAPTAGYQRRRRGREDVGRLIKP